MAEIGIDISTHRSKSIEEFAGQSFDTIVTTCDAAKDICPVFPGEGERLHWSLVDPAAAKGSRDEKLEFFRRVRHEVIKLTRLNFLATPK